MSIGEKIKEVREARHFSQEAVAKALGLSVTSYAKIERNEVEVTVNRLEQIAEVLKVKTWAFFSPESSIFIVGDIGKKQSGGQIGVSHNYSGNFNPEREAYLAHIGSLEKQTKQLEKQLDEKQRVIDKLLLGK
jgi:transcriptional regulator with XRE-family HTH domain